MPGIGRPILIGGQLQLRVGHRHGHARLQACNHAEVVRLVRRTEFKLEWQPEVSRIVGDKVAADYAYNLIRLSVELNVVADDVRDLRRIAASTDRNSAQPHFRRGGCLPQR